MVRMDDIGINRRFLSFNELVNYDTLFYEIINKSIMFPFR